MRLYLVDTLLERHVAESLARALSARGHDVHSTGPVWRGERLPDGAEDRSRLAAVVDRIIDSRPDVVLVIRSSALRPEQVDRLREHEIFTVAWFADDPVLYSAHTALVATHYDLTLHAATAPVLARYESDLGVRGLAFPFWTDAAAFPRLYDPRRCDLDLVFIGNTHSRIKRWRYDWVAALPLSRAIYGRAVEDPAGIHAGIARDDAALARACARGRWGMNISQRFVDYAGTWFDFPGLAEFGEFALPSRIVQLAAVGVPTISLAGSDEAARSMSTLFPPVVSVRDREQVVALVSEVGDDADVLSARSDAMYAWYASHYTAATRARFLERLVAAPAEWTALPAGQRATAFLGTPARSETVDRLVVKRNRATRAVRKAMGRALRAATVR